MKTEGKKKSLLAAIWESMTKSGGCCGSGQSCCGPADENDKKNLEKDNSTESEN